MNFGVNGLYVLVATITHIVVGMLWYSPLLFAKPWMKALGLKQTDVSESGVSPVPGYIGSTIYAAGLAYIIGLLIINLGIDGIPGALGIAGLLWLVTSGLANLRIKFFEDRPWSLYLIDEGNTLVVYLLTAILAALWM